MTQDVLVRRTLVVDGFATSYFDMGEGPAVLLLHGGEFGAGAEVCWERTMSALAEGHRVVAPDLLGFGHTDKVADFVDGRGRRVRHLESFCKLLDLRDAVVVGNSMGGMLALFDAASAAPVLPARAVISIAGGGKLTSSEHTDALFEYDGSLKGMRAIVRALFHAPRWAEDDAYVQRRHELSIAPGAWEAIAASRFARPGADDERPRSQITYANIAVPTLVIAGAEDKLKPAGWTEELTSQIPSSRSAVVEEAGHCPQLEQPETVNGLLKDFVGDPHAVAGSQRK